MDRNTILILTMAMILAVAGIYLIRGSNTDTQAISFDGVYSINDILAMNKGLQCTYEKSDDASQVKGTVFVSEGRVRGEFDITSGGQNFKSYFILKDGVNYTWISLFKNGFKTNISDTGDVTTTTNGYTTNPDEKEEYKCMTWVEKRGTFDVPRDIVFSAI